MPINGFSGSRSTQPQVKPQHDDASTQFPTKPKLVRSARFYGGTEPHFRAPEGFLKPVAAREYRTIEQLEVFAFIKSADESDAASVFLGILKDMGALVDSETGLVTPPDNDHVGDVLTLRLRLTKHLESTDGFNEIISNLKNCLCLSHLVEQLANSNELQPWLKHLGEGSFDQLSAENLSALKAELNKYGSPD